MRFYEDSRLEAKIWNSHCFGMATAVGVMV